MGVPENKFLLLWRAACMLCMPWDPFQKPGPRVVTGGKETLASDTEAVQWYMHNKHLWIFPSGQCRGLQCVICEPHTGLACTVNKLCDWATTYFALLWP